jgi:hypothetical protein
MGRVPSTVLGLIGLATMIVSISKVAPRTLDALGKLLSHDHLAPGTNKRQGCTSGKSSSYRLISHKHIDTGRN